MRISPKLALTTTAVLVAVGLLWVGFAEGGRNQTITNHGSGVAGQYLHQSIAAETIAASAAAGTGASPAASQPRDNVPALALSGMATAALVMLALTFARFQAVRHTFGTVVRSEAATPRRARLVANGTLQL